jgi:hypothetical protein
MAWDPLVTPAHDFFPPTPLTGHPLAEDVLQRVRRLMRAEEPCELAPPEAYGLTPDDNGPLLITYTDASQPWLLVSELAHGVAGVMLAPFQDELPEGKDSFWPAASLLVVHKGLGLFALNAAFQYEGIGKYGRLYEAGYLSEQAFAFALAVYLALTNRIGAADGWIKPGDIDLLHEAQKYVARNPGLLPNPSPAPPADAPQSERQAGAGDAAGAAEE